MKADVVGHHRSINAYRQIIKTYGVLAVFVGLYCKVRKFHIAQNRVVHTHNVTPVWHMHIVDGVQKIILKVKVFVPKVHWKVH